MTEKMIENRVKKLQELEAQIKALEAAADAVREEIKAELPAVYGRFCKATTCRRFVVA